MNADTKKCIKASAIDATAKAAALEAIFRKLAEGNALTFEEQTVLDAERFTERELEAEFGRVSGVIQWQAKAGTTRDREQAADDHTAALAELDAERPVLEQRIAELRQEEQKLAKLEQRVASTGRIVERQNDALERLRKLAPPACHRQFAHAERQLNSGKLKRLPELSSRRKMIDAVLKLNISDVADRGQAVEHAKSARPQAVHTSRHPSSKEIKRSLNDDAWRQYTSELHAELPGLEAEISELTAVKEQALAEAATCLDFYAR